MIGMAALLAAGLAEDLPLVQPAELAAQLASKNPRPVIFQVGPNVLYRGKHIVGAIYAGPAAKPAGLDLLKEAAGKLPRDREIVLYCGCCPWSNCPNVKPAIALLRQMGFTHVKAMFIETNFSKDWTEKGYPVEAGAAKN
jgi:rhodanese-related sulfurtransferase